MAAAKMDTAIIERGVLVTNIPYVTDEAEDLKDKLEIHFENSKKGGGGEVESIVCRVKGDMNKAIVIFKSNEDVKNVLGHRLHTFCDSGELQVEPLPPVFSDVHGDIDEFFWEVMKVQHVQKVTKELTKQYDVRHLKTSNGYISRVDVSFEQLKEVEYTLLNYGPLRDECRSSEQHPESMLRITSMCLEITGIPFITDDKNEMADELHQYFKTMTGNDLAGLACGVHGDLKRAIAVFSSCEDMELVMKHNKDAGFHGRTLSVTSLPPVIKVYAKFNTYYMDLIPKLRREKLLESNPSIDKKNFQFVGPLYEADKAIAALLETIGIKQVAPCVAIENTDAIASSTSANSDSSDINQLRSQNILATGDDYSATLSKDTASKRKYNTRASHRSDNKPETKDESVKEASRYPGKAIQQVNDETNLKPAPVIQYGNNEISQGLEQKHHLHSNKQSMDQHNDREEAATLETEVPDAAEANMVHKFDDTRKGKHTRFKDGDNGDHIPQTSEHSDNHNKFAEIREPLTDGQRAFNSGQPGDKKYRTGTSNADAKTSRHTLPEEEEKISYQNSQPTGGMLMKDELSDGFAQVDNIKFDYMTKTKGDEFNDMQAKYGVSIIKKIHQDKDPSILVVVMQKNRGKMPTPPEHVVKEDPMMAMQEFLALYSQTIANVTTKTLDCTGVKPERATKAATKIDRKFNDILIVQEGKDQFTFCGTESSIDDGIREFRMSAGMSEEEQNASSDSLLVDKAAFQFLTEHNNSGLVYIQKSYHVTVDLEKGPPSSTDYVARFKPTASSVGKQKKKVTQQEIKDAKEEFITLYQKTFFSIKRTSLKCPGVTKEVIRRALATTRKDFFKITLVKTGTDDYILCSEESEGDRAVQCFRKACGLQPAARKLKKPDILETSSSVHASSTPNDSFQQKPEATYMKNKPQDLPSAFITKEGVQIITLTGDITQQSVGAIVNAANRDLKHNGGVAKAISTAAGPDLQKESNTITSGWRRINIGECVETKGYNLPCHTVIHTVGPNFHDDQKSFGNNLMKTFSNVLHNANCKGNVKTIAIPLISSGNYGGPMKICTEALTAALFDFSKLKQSSHLQQVYLVNIQEETTLAIQRSLNEKFTGPNNEKREGVDSNLYQGEIKGTYQTKEGFNIVIVKGDITNTKTDVIVNAANEFLRHGSGVAGAISTAAGPELQRESDHIMAQRQRQPLQMSEVVETDGYNLPCRKVVHAVGPRRKDCPSDEVFYTALRETFLNVLKYTNLRIEAASVTLPLISSGVFAGSKEQCSKALLDAIREFTETEPTLIIKTLFLLNIDDEATDAIVKTFDTYFHKDDVKSVHKGTIQSYIYKTAEGLEIQVKESDITNQTTDAIVNPTDTALNHVGLVSKAIKTKAGPAFDRECREIMKKRKWEYLKPGQVVYTSGGNLQCKHVIHTASPTYVKRPHSQYGRQLKETFIACLESADHQLKASDIALPVIGSGISAAPKDLCASSLIQAIASISKNHKLVYLKQIVVVSMNSEMIAELHKTFSTHFNRVIQQTTFTGKGLDDVYHVEMERNLAKNTQSNQIQSTMSSSSLTFMTDNGIKVIALRGDITKLKADVLLKSTDEKLMHDDEVSNIINKEAGPELQKECKQILKDRKRLKPGEFVTSSGHNLPYNKIIHFVKPSPKSLEDLLMEIMLHAKTALKATTMAISASSISLHTTASGEFLYMDVFGRVVKRFSKCVADKSVKSIFLVGTDDVAFATMNNVLGAHFKRIAVDGTSSINDSNQAVGGHNTNGEGRGTQSWNQSSGQYSTRSSNQESSTHPSNQPSGVYPSNPSLGQVTSYSNISTRVTSNHPTQPLTTYSSSQTTMAYPPTQHYRQPTQSSNYATDAHLANPSGGYDTRSHPQKTNEHATNVSGTGATYDYKQAIAPASSSVWSSGESPSNVPQHQTPLVPMKADDESRHGNVGKEPHCLICRSTSNVKPLEFCKHTFCDSCIKMHVAPKSLCKECRGLYCVTEEKTSKGKMTYYFNGDMKLPDSGKPGAITIVYDFPSGIQGLKDPAPGQPYNGIVVTAFLPNDNDGCKVVRQLRTAFIAGRIFAVKDFSNQSYGMSLTGLIPHKLGGRRKEDYPDKQYMAEVKKALSSVV